MSPARQPRRGVITFMMGSVLASVLFLGTACGAAPAPGAVPDARAVPDAGAANLPASAASAAKARDELATLGVKGRAPKTGYSREEFGQAWADVDRNGCDTRNDILGRDLTATTFKPGTSDCQVLTGVLADPYTGSTVSFVRGSATSSAVQIDHVVALSDAWQKGAQQLTVEQRTALGNDPLNLLAVDGPSNQQKGAGDAATWLPPNNGYHCEYVVRQITVKAAYKLWVTQAEHDAMEKVLDSCANKDVPTSLAPPAEVHYQNCSAVRAAGAAPIHADQPGFQATFDGDGDGVGCE